MWYRIDGWRKTRSTFEWHTKHMASSVPSLFRGELVGRISTLFYRPVRLYSVSYLLLISHQNLNLKLIIKQHKLLGRKVLCISELEIWLFLTPVGVQWQMKSERGLKIWRKTCCKKNECANYKKCLRLVILIEYKHMRITI